MVQHMTSENLTIEAARVRRRQVQSDGNSNNGVQGNNMKTV
jgi:hypothetical protein